MTRASCVAGERRPSSTSAMRSPSMVTLAPDTTPGDTPSMRLAPVRTSRSIMLRSVHPARAPRPVGLAELELLQLARRRADQRVPELDRGGALVVRHPAAAVLHEFALGGRRTRAQHDERLDRLAPLLVG